MQHGHMVFDSECYQTTLSGQAVKVNSWIIYIRLVKRLALITRSEALYCANHPFSQISRSHKHTARGEDSLLRKGSVQGGKEEREHRGRMCNLVPGDKRVWQSAIRLLVMECLCYIIHLNNVTFILTCSLSHTHTVLSVGENHSLIV